MFRAILALAAISSVIACPGKDHNKLNKRLDVDIDVNSTIKDWNYDNPAAWGSIKPEYSACGHGATQSPINLNTKDLSKVQKPTFDYTTRVSGKLGNWGYGPAFIASGNITSRPSFIADGKDYHLYGFHTHTTSEHTIDGKCSKMEIHLVHEDSAGRENGVVGFPIEVGPPSAFFAQMLSTNAIPGTTSLETIDMVNLDMSLLLAEVKNMKCYWTYSGSFTSPPCTEGLRWWVSSETLKASQAQIDALMAVSKFSSRGVQALLSHAVSQ